MRHSRCLELSPARRWASCKTKGVLRPRKGVGSFVALNKRIDHLAESLVGLKEDAASHGYELTDQIITCELRPADQRIARILGIDPGADIVMLERARSLDGEPCVLVRSVMPADLCGPVADYDLTDRSLYDVLSNDLELKIVKATRSIEATAASEFVARWLEVEEGSPTLLLKSTSFLVTGRPVEYFIAWHRSDRSRFEVHLQRETRGTAVAHADVVTGFPRRSRSYPRAGTAMTKLRIGIVGGGRAGALHARNLTRVLGADVVSVIDPNPETGGALAAELDAVASPTLSAALEQQLDAVVISTPTFTHCDLVVDSCQAGLHVFCEKPLGLTVEECDAMIAAADAADVIIQVGFVRRFQPEMVEAKARIDSGEIGDITFIRSVTRGPGLPPDWANNIEMSNGMLAEVNSHDFDCVRWMTGDDYHRIYAEVANRKGEALGVPYPNFYDNVVVNFKMEEGIIGSIDGVCPCEYGYDARVEIVGTKGLLIVGDVQGMPLLSATDRNTGAVRAHSPDMA